MDEPFFGLLALRLQLKEDTRCRSMWTDSVTLGFNPRYVNELAEIELRGLIGHVVLHIAAGHPWRQGSRDAARWDKSTDFAINPVLIAAGFRLPAGSLLDSTYSGKPAELIYVALQRLEAEQDDKHDAPSESGKPQRPQPALGMKVPGSEGHQSSEEGAVQADSDNVEGSSPGENNDVDCSSSSQGQPDGNPCEEFDSSSEKAPGEVRPAPDGSNEAEWKMAIQAAVRMQGSLPGALERLVDSGLQPRVDWKEALRQFVQTSVYSPDYSWSRPNRRWIHQGLYLPGLQGTNIGCMVIARDTSGSVGDEYLRIFNTEILDILLAHKPDVAYVIDCDAKIAQVITIEPQEVPDSLPAKGGGGTRFEPVFEWVEAQGLNPTCLVYLTDLQGSFPAEDPGYPVLWAVPEGNVLTLRAPFGDVLSLSLN